MSIRIGSLFSGYGGLDLGVQAVLGGTVAWHAEIEKAPSRILEHRFPDVPNLGDVTKVDWAQVEPVDVLTGGFPCFPAGTLVTTEQGLVPIEDVEEGDLVYTHAGRWRPVVQTMSRTADHRVEVKAMGTPTIVTTDEHPFYVRRTRLAAPEWVKARDLARGMLLAQPEDTPSRGPAAAPDERAEAEWYLVGRWLGDGWVVTHRRTSTVPQGQRGSRVTSTARRVHWCSAPHEVPAMTRAFDAAGLRPTVVEDRTATKFVMQSAAWAERLAEFGQYAHGKCLPEHVHAMPHRYQAALLRGWLDSDGDVKADGTINGTTASKALALGMARLARTVHGKPVSLHEVVPAATKVIEGRVVRQRLYWNVRVSSGMPRQAFIADGFAWVPVRTVSRVAEPQRVYNIGVGEDESYVADSVVVHNCQDVSHAGKRAGLGGDGARSGLWVEMAAAIAALRPSLVVIENVRGLLSAKAERSPDAAPVDLNAITWETSSAEAEPDGDDLGPEDGDLGQDDRTGPVLLRALGAVLGDLSDLGYDAWWATVRAADAGAPHGRARVFVFAWPAQYTDACGWNPGEGLGEGSGAVRSHDIRGAGSEPARNTEGHHFGYGTVTSGGSARRAQQPTRSASSAARDTEGVGVEGQRPGRIEEPRAHARPGVPVRAGFEPAPDASDDGRERSWAPRGRRHGPPNSSHTPPHTGGERHGGGEPHPQRGGAQPAPHTLSGGRDGRAHEPLGREVGGTAPAGSGETTRTREPAPHTDQPTATRLADPSQRETVGGTPARGSGAEPCGCPAWGQYAPAVHRWEHVLGRAAPAPTELGPKGSHRLSARAVEWMMGLPDGWVTGVPGIGRNEALKALGNGVVPQQAALATVRWLGWADSEGLR